MLSIITSLSSVNIIFECFPIISTYSFLEAGSPSSSKCSKCMQIIRSKPKPDILLILAFPTYFLSNIQKLGAVMGLVLLSSVRYISGREAFADIRSL